MGIKNLPSDPDLIHLAEHHPADGRALRYHADEFIAHWIMTLGKSLTTSPQFACAAKYFDRDLLAMYVENALLKQLQSTGRAYIRRDYLKCIGRSSQKPVACPSLLFGLVCRHWPDSTIPIVSKGGRGLLRQKIAFAYRRTRDLILRLMRPPTESSRSYKIAVELVEGSDPKEKCDAFWLAQGDVDPEQVLFIMSPENKVFFDAEKEYANIQRMGAGAVALHPSVSAGDKIPQWRPTPGPSWLGAYRASLPSALKPEEHWLNHQLLYLGEQVAYWESFFRHFGIKMYQHFTEDGADMAIRRIAIKRVGGVEMGKMRSFFVDSLSMKFSFQHDLAFVWHPKYKKWLDSSRTKVVVPIGYTWDYLIALKKPEAKNIRLRLLGGKAKRIITLYDSFPHLNCYFKLEHIKSFYKKILELVCDDDDLAIIVKSKSWRILEMLPEERGILNDLIDKKRGLIIGKKFSSAITPALAADLVVAIPAGTVILEAALAGRRVLAYDPGSPANHPFYAQEGLVHRCMEEFIEAVKKNISWPSRSPEVDNHKLLAKSFSYTDATAAQRAGNIIEKILSHKENDLIINELLLQGNP